MKTTLSRNYFCNYRTFPHPIKGPLSLQVTCDKNRKKKLLKKGKKENQTQEAHSLNTKKMK